MFKEHLSSNSFDCVMGPAKPPAFLWSNTSLMLVQLYNLLS